MKKIQNRLVRYRFYWLQLITLQLFLFLLSLPILLLWGLPISVMAIISTPIFAPFLTVFLGISVLIFFCTLCSIPCGVLLKILDTVVVVWDFFLQKGSGNWLYGFAIPTESAMIFFTVINVIFLLYSLRFSYTTRLQLLGIYAAAVLGCFSLYTYAQKSEQYIVYRNKQKKVILYGKQGFTALIDQGFFTQSKSPDAWVLYTLIPMYMKRFGGKCRFDVIIVQKLTVQSISMLIALVKNCDIRHIIIPAEENSKITQSDHFRSFIDKVTTSCVTITTVKEQHVLCIVQDITICCTYNQKNKCLEAWRNKYGAEKSVIRYIV